MDLTRDEILGASDLVAESVQVPEWGGAVRVRCMTAAERDEYEQTLVATEGEAAGAHLRNIRARLIAMCAVDAQDKRMFSIADIEALGAKSARAMNRVFKVAVRLNALSAGDIEELKKNSDGDPSAASLLS